MIKSKVKSTSIPKPKKNTKKAKDNMIKPVVLQVLPELGQGGVEVGTIQIAGGLVDKGYTNFVASKGGRMLPQLDKIKVKHFALPLKSKNPLTIMKNANILAEIIKKEGINIVHARSRAPAWSAYFAAKKAKVTYITTFHGTYGLGPKGIKKIYNKVMVLGQKVIVISSHIKNHVLEHYKVDEDKLEFIHRCVDVNRFNPEAITEEQVISFLNEHQLPTDKKIILLVGRLTRWKGQELLIKALAKIKDRDDFVCVFVGDDQGRVEYTQGLKNQIKENNMEGRVIFIRHLDNIPVMMKVSNIVVSTSLDPEAFGRIAAEGQAMGKIVIASNIGGSLDNLKDNITGRHFASGDEHDLADKLSWALDLDDKSREEISQNAISFIKENFTKEIMCSKTIKVYENILNNH